MPLPAPHERLVPVAVTMVNAPDLSLRGPNGAVAISGRHLQFVQSNDKTYQPIASVAALTAQPLAALPPYGCGVPLAGCERHWQLQIPVYPADRTDHQICHCEEAGGRRGALSAQREEVPLGCNLGKALANFRMPLPTAPALVGERHAAPGDALAVRTRHRQNGKRSRLVIARPRRGRGNLGKAVTILSERACYPPGSCEISTSLRSSE